MANVRLTSTHDPAHVRVPYGWRLIKLDSVDSTNLAMRRMVETGADTGEGTVMWAREQTAGKGRSGRAWVGAAGNLYASVLLESPESARAHEIGFIAALAVIGAIQATAPDHASDDAIKCKWPNDVLLHGGKVAGILAEAVSAPTGETRVVLGIGINVQPVDVPEALYPIASLAEHGANAPLSRLLEALLHDLHARLALWRRDGFAPVRAEWLRRATGLGQPITVKSGTKSIEGEFADIDTDGALVVTLANGARERVLAGDVVRS